jgi:hypothetical protein
LFVPCVFALQGSHQCLGQMRTASHPWKFLSAMFIRVAYLYRNRGCFFFYHGAGSCTGVQTYRKKSCIETQ